VFGAHGQTFMGRGTHAEYVIANTMALASKPVSIAGPAAAAIPLAGVTAMMSVDAVQASPGDTILIVGAAGGVGSFAVQIAKARGARVIAVGRKVNHDYLRGLGAAETVDYEGGDLVERVRAVNPTPIDGIIDLASDAETVRRLTGSFSMVEPWHAGRDGADGRSTNQRFIAAQ
jgi:NADPH2:quinone reductase